MKAPKVLRDFFLILRVQDTKNVRVKLQTGLACFLNHSVWWFTCEGSSLVSGHRPEVAEVALVSNLHDDNVVVSMVPQLLQPAFNVFVRQVLGDVVN